MLTRDTHYIMVAPVLQNQYSGLATSYTNDTKAVSKDIPLFFCVMYPHICTFQGYIEQETFTVCRFPFVSARQPVLCSPFCFGEHRGLPFNLFTNGGATMHTATSTPTVSNHISSIPNETYYTVSLGKQAGQMSIIIKYHVDNQQWRFVDISAGITFLINPDTNLISFTQEQHDKAIQTFSQELRKFVSQQIPYGQENDSHITINIEDTGETMNNTPQIFNFDNNTAIRTILKNGTPYFVVKDVCDALDLSNPRQAIADLKTNYELIQVSIDGVISTDVIYDTIGRKQEMTIINETGLYDLIMQSRKPSALKFKHWITSEVLPSIRKHGFYGTYEWVEEQLSNPDTLITILQNYKTEKDAKIAAQQQVKQLNGKIEEDKPKVLFAESVVASETAILVGELAKLIKQNGYNIGQNRLFEWLRENGYMMRNSDGVNIPTQKSMNLGLFRMKEVSILTGEGKPPRICITTKVTGKGQLYFINKFLSKTPQQAA